MYAKIIDNKVDALAEEIPFIQSIVKEIIVDDQEQEVEIEKVIDVLDTDWEDVEDYVQLGFIKNQDGTFSPTPEILQQKQEEFIDAVRNEVAKRILAHASQGTQMNMAAAAAGGLLAPEQLQAFQQGLAWVASIRAKGKELIVNGVQDFSDDKHWPKPTPAAKALSETF